MEQVHEIVAAVVLVSLTFLGLYPIGKKAIVAIRRKQINMGFLMALAIIGALALGEFKESALVVVLLLTANHLEEGRSSAGAYAIYPPFWGHSRRIPIMTAQADKG